jgi:molybdopterin converting factor small subunit
MATVWIPSLMRDLTAGQNMVEVAGATVGQIIEALDSAYPGIKDRLCIEGQIDPAIAVHIDGRIARMGLLERIEPDSEIRFLPAAAGG